MKRRLLAVTSFPGLTTRTLAEQVQRLGAVFGKTSDLGADSNASGDFQDSCDQYEAWAFTLEAENGRTYYLTIEDVTIREEES